MSADKELRFKRKYFLMVQSGEKELEARLNYPFIRHIKVGNKVRFFWENLSINVQITGIRRYRNFRDMLEREDNQKLIPGMSKSEALQEYENIYPQWKVNKFGGVVVFSFKVLGNT